MKILFVDDDAIHREYMQALLTTSEVEVQTAINGRDALSLIDAHSFDLILTDIQMPVMNGIEMTREIRAAGNSIPIIAITAHESEEFLEEFNDAGIDEVVIKPLIDIDDFYTKCEALIARKS